MKRKIRLTESDLHKIVKESVKRIIKESEVENAIFFDLTDRSDVKEEWDEAGLNIYDFYMERDQEVADFHNSREGYTIFYDGEEFGEVWYERSLGCYRGLSDDDIFGGYKRGFEGMSLDDIFEDIMDKASDAILNGDDDDYDDDYDY